MEWWTPEQAGFMGAILGGGFGGVMLGGIGGGVCGTLAGKGLARGFVVNYLRTMGAIGVILLLAGIVGASIGQPYHVWYPLVLPGGLASFLVIVILKNIVVHYDKHEKRRLAAEEMRRS